MGKKNQIYGRWKRLLPNPDNPNEIYLVLEKDVPMDIKYIRQFEDMFMNKDVILTIGVLIRNKNGSTEEEKPSEEPKERKRGKKIIEETMESEETTPKEDSPFWSVEQ